MPLSRAKETRLRAQHALWNARHVRFPGMVVDEVKTGAAFGATGASTFDAPCEYRPLPAVLRPPFFNAVGRPAYPAYRHMAHS